VRLGLGACHAAAPRLNGDGAGLGGTGATTWAEIPDALGVGGHTRARMDLSVHERAILDFERSWWCFPGPKESAIRARLGVSTSHYYRVLGELMDKPAAFDYDPLTVKRLRRSREVRRRGLAGRRADPGTR